MKKVVVLLAVIGCIGIFGLVYFFIFNQKVEIELNGNNPDTLEVNIGYNDPGIIIKNRNKEISKDKYKLNKDSNLDINKLGNYEIKYFVKYRGKDYSIKRSVNVIDITNPIIDVNTDTVNKDYCNKKITTDLKYIASDNYDGDITNKITLNEENDKLILRVSDSSNNSTIKEIKINYLNKPKNKFSLIGKSNISIPLNGKYEESGANLTDGCGNKINAEISITGRVDTSSIGEYKIVYKTKGENDISRIINVYDPSKKTSNKIIYLTFDDGPNYNTKKVLDILDKYNVKATFFVTGQFPSYLSLIKDEYTKGHKIAVHTYSHKYSVYTSVDTYLDDFNKMNEIIKDYTGSYTKLFRFPGGSSNTVSKSYNKGIMTELSNKMTNDGYYYFDWNVSSGDASANPTSTKVYNNVVNGVKSCSKCVVLMHDIKSATANALDDMLSTLTSNGYSFDTLSENGPYAHHSINN